ncbi:MAG: SH3 domain-containing protein [Lachnospiraceae bacterium]|nr:SH3 domain-containing protein [Lachnospiraceae bacterium]
MRVTKKRIATFLLLLVMGVNVIGITAFAGDIQPRKDYCYVNTSDGSNLNGRSGPGTEYPVICRFANGTSLSWSVFPENNATDSQGRSWMAVTGTDINGKQKSAWVCEDYLRFEPDWYFDDAIERVYSNPELEPVG